MSKAVVHIWISPYQVQIVNLNMKIQFSPSKVYIFIYCKQTNPHTFPAPQSKEDGICHKCRVPEGPGSHLFITLLLVRKWNYEPLKIPKDYEASVLLPPLSVSTTLSAFQPQTIEDTSLLQDVHPFCGSTPPVHKMKVLFH